MTPTPISSERVQELLMSRFNEKLWPTDTYDTKKEFCNDLTAVFHNLKSFDPVKFQAYPLVTILHYLRRTHQYYLEKRLGEIELSVQNVLKDLPEEISWGTFLSRFFQSYKTELQIHIEDEEKNLFPYIEALLDAKNSYNMRFMFNQKIELINFLLNHNHDTEDNLRALIKVLKEKSQSFDLSLSFRVLLIQLESFELDLNIHARMEEEVLMPLALKLEQETLKNSSFNDIVLNYTYVPIVFPKILVQGDYFNIAKCIDCHRIGLYYKNLLIGFEQIDFECFCRIIR